MRETAFLSLLTFLWLLKTGLLGLLLGGLVLLFLLRSRHLRIRQELRDKSPHACKVVLGFFHPYCSGGGGGERVLWKMVQDIGSLRERGFSVQIVIYTVDKPTTTNYKQGTAKKKKKTIDTYFVVVVIVVAARVKPDNEYGIIHFFLLFFPSSFSGRFTWSNPRPIRFNTFDASAN